MIRFEGFSYKILLNITLEMFLPKINENQILIIRLVILNFQFLKNLLKHPLNRYQL